jgi:hypothetical protein
MGGSDMMLPMVAFDRQVGKSPKVPTRCSGSFSGGLTASINLTPMPPLHLGLRPDER